jgi:hypothetical protein
MWIDWLFPWFFALDYMVDVLILFNLENNTLFLRWPKRNLWYPYMQFRRWVMDTHSSCCGENSDHWIENFMYDSSPSSAQWKIVNMVSFNYVFSIYTCHSTIALICLFNFILYKKMSFEIIQPHAFTYLKYHVKLEWLFFVRIGMVISSMHFLCRVLPLHGIWALRLWGTITKSHIG